MSDTAASVPDIPNWTVMVLLSRQKRVRHIAVWGQKQWDWPGTLCRNRGTFPVYGRMDEFPGVPVCTRCQDEAELIANAIRRAE